MSRLLMSARLPTSASSLCSIGIRQRLFATTSASRADEPRSPLRRVARNMDREERDAEANALNMVFGRSVIPTSNEPRETVEELEARLKPPPTYHLHILATKHNTHITLTSPERNPIISKSAGDIGFRKSARGTYDAAFQLSSYVLGQIYEGGLFAQIKSVQVVLRGFGVGREAVTKSLLGTEGRLMRPKITEVTDATRLKFGGTRSRKPRRLG